jgi:hypothetical protein
MFEDMTARDKQKALVDEGVCKDMDEAAHMLVDMGEINSTEHYELLSPAERKKAYGE